MAEPTLADLADYQAKDPQQALDAALVAVQSYCGWHISPSVTETVTVWSKDGCVLFLKTLALTAIISIVQDGVTIPSTSYTFESYGAVRVVPGSYFSRLSKLTVNFTHGYTTLPKDAKDVALALAQRSINDTRGMVARGGGATGVVVVQQYGSQLTDADKAKLDPYTVSAGFA